MKSRERTFLIVVICLIAGTAGALQYMKSHQRLGKPGVRTTELPETIKVRIELATNAPGYFYKESELDQTNVLDRLPFDTSIRQGLYRNADGEIQKTVVIMGTDRTSIHKPQFCLTGAGWDIDASRSAMTNVHLTRPQSLNLEVMKLVASRKGEVEGKQVNLSGVYVYWFVADQAVTADHNTRMWWMAKHLLRTGELQRWAYISYFAPCRPGGEDQAFERIKKLMNATVPDFQLAWPATVETAGVTP